MKIEIAGAITELNQTDDLDLREPSYSFAVRQVHMIGAPIGGPVMTGSRGHDARFYVSEEQFKELYSAVRDGSRGMVRITIESVEPEES